MACICAMKYYYNKDGKNIGPVTIEELYTLADQGVIQPRTPVIEAGKKEWTRWGEMVEEKAQPKEEPVIEKRPAAQPVSPTPRAERKVQAEEPQQSSLLALAGRVTRFYEAIDRTCEKLCSLPKSFAVSPEQSKEKLSVLNAIVGVGSLLCILSFGLANGWHTQNFLLLLALVVVGAVIQYVCYQMYSAMLPLLFGNKIRLSSLWLPRTLALVCALLILGCVLVMLQLRQIDYVLLMLVPIMLLAGISYSSMNCTKLSVELCPEGVVPGRELINLVRFLARVFFTTVHVLTPVCMVLAMLAILFGGSSGPQMYGMSRSLFFLPIGGNPLHMYALTIAVLPIFTLPLFYICSFIPDFVESFFTHSDNKSN